MVARPSSITHTGVSHSAKRRAPLLRQPLRRAVGCLERSAEPTNLRFNVSAHLQVCQHAER